MSVNERLQGKTTIVTGGAQGIGRAIALEFAREGAQVAIADIDRAKAQETAEVIRKQAGTVLVLETDVSREGDVSRMVAAAIEHFKTIDVLVNNVGIYPRKSWSEVTTEEWQRFMAVNLFSHFLCAKAVVPFMREKRKGKIINISSVSFFLGHPANLVHYIASKGGVIGLTRSLARELGDYGINVNVITPGAVETEAEKRIATPEAIATIVSQQCLKWRVQPEHIAKVALFLASDDSDAITGQTINVDAGWILH